MVLRLLKLFRNQAADAAGHSAFRYPGRRAGSGHPPCPYVEGSAANVSATDLYQLAGEAEKNKSRPEIS